MKRSFAKSVFLMQPRFVAALPSRASLSSLAALPSLAAALSLAVMVAGVAGDSACAATVLNGSGSTFQKAVDGKCYHRAVRKAARGHHH